jgi:hypothetical protein
MTCSRVVVLFLILVAVAYAQPQPAPQTARQALLEMFFSKMPGTFDKHLPEATKAALGKADPASGASMMQGFSMMTSQLSARGQQLQTFDTGSTLLLVEDAQTHSRFEITVESDDLRSDEDTIELSFKSYKDGQQQASGIAPRPTFLMKQETGIWRHRRSSQCYANHHGCRKHLRLYFSNNRVYLFPF